MKSNTLYDIDRITPVLIIISPSTKATLLILIILIFSAVNTGIAQNICTNGNFDTYTTPPNNYSQICYANGWLNPSGICNLVAGTGSPDYYNTLGSGGAKPPATWWATLMPHSGTGMAGFATWYNSPNYREYIYRQLSSPMTVGQTYQVTFWISNGVSWLHLVGTNNIGVNFSTNPLLQTFGNPILLTPQLETTGVTYSTGWTQILFSYTATLAYQYVTIGNFHNDASTIHSSFGTGTYANYGCYYYIDDIVIQPATPLPVSFLSFTGENIKNTNHLEWVTATEINNAYFEIEKSIDGIYFSPIGTVAGNGNSSDVKSYEFNDYGPLSHINYYKLRQTDYNGAFSYSSVLAVKIKLQQGVSLISTAVPGIYKIEYYAVQEGTVTVTDLRGHIINTLSISKENPKAEVDLRYQPKGIFFISVSSNQETKTIKAINF